MVYSGDTIEGGRRPVRRLPVARRMVGGPGTGTKWNWNRSGPAGAGLATGRSIVDRGPRLTGCSPRPCSWELDRTYAWITRYYILDNIYY